jgi:hypothetical protein
MRRCAAAFAELLATSTLAEPLTGPLARSRLTPELSALGMFDRDLAVDGFGMDMARAVEPAN